MKKVLIVVAAVLTIGVTAFVGTSTTDQAYDTWQPEPKMSSFYGNDIR